jgi:beta-lactamase regulating signal transducer with metallopeptidase domain
MLTEIFYWLLNMSLLGAAMGLIILLLRRIRRLPRRLVCWLWLVPFLRFWLPVSLPSRFSLLNLLAGITVRSVPFGSPDGNDLAYTNFIQAANGYFPLVFKSRQLLAVFAAGSWFWVVVFAALAILMLVWHHRAVREVRGARRWQDNIYRSDRVAAPAVYGIFKPRVLIPETIDEADLPAVILHEAAHIRRADNLWRTLALATACLHWFNPLAWIFLIYFFEDLELACDAAAVRSFDLEARKSYAATLLRFTAHSPLAVSAFGGAKIKTRIENILSYRRLTLAAGVFFSILLAAIVMVLLTNAQT